jgi:hypothetical protein
MKLKNIILMLLGLLVCWIAIDLGVPFQTDIRKIDSVEAARLDAAMWRSYYERKPITLFFQAAELIRGQFHAPFWRSHVIAYHSAKAAFIFKDGRTRDEYQNALPNLRCYYEHINAISDTPFNVDSVAQLELEWWIVRRYREKHPPVEWEKYLAASAEAMYHVPAAQFADYARLRVRAMLLRDGKGENITEQDWGAIHDLLLSAWKSFARAVGPTIVQEPQ